MFSRIAALTAVPALTASALLVPSAAHAAGPHRRLLCAPLKFTKSYISGGESWQTKASLRSTTCATRAPSGKVYLRGTGGTTEVTCRPTR